MFRERMRNMPPELREKRFANVGDPRRRDRFMSTYEHGVHSPFVLHAIAAYERAFKLMEQTLTEHGPWLLGAKPTLADINLMPFAARMSYLGLLEAWTTGRPRINEWCRNGRVSSAASTTSSPRPNSPKCAPMGRKSAPTSRRWSRGCGRASDRLVPLFVPCPTSRRTG